jgi:hypothetical protein
MNKFGKLIEEAAKALAKTLPKPKPVPLPPPPLPFPDTKPDTPPTTIPGDKPVTGDKTKDDTVTKTETETKRRERNCCDPSRFQSEWPKGTRPAVNAAGNLLAYRYQVQICGPFEYKCASSTGVSVWADGLLSGKCWMIDTKWSRTSKDSLFRLSKPYFLWQAVDDEIRRCGIVANSPAPPAQPCWMIGLQITTTHHENKEFFVTLLNNHSLPVSSRGDVNIVRFFDELEKEVNEQVQKEIEELKKILKKEGN